MMEIPEGHEVQIRPRSGLAIKNGVTVLNSPGTIDCDYRGEVAVILINSGQGIQNFPWRPYCSNGCCRGRTNEIFTF